MSFGEQRSYHKKFKFIVEIDGFVFAGFQKCSALEAMIAVIEQWEGGSIIPVKEPGRITVSNITLERGATKDLDAYNWFRQAADMVANTGLVDPEYKRNFDIVQQDRDGSELRRWTQTNGWPCKFVAGEWDNDADENVIEQLELCFDTFELVA